MPPTHAPVVRRALDTGGQHATTAPFSLLHTYFAGVHTNLLRHEHRPEWQGTRHKMGVGPCAHDAVTQLCALKTG
jgi:hypothetical protein